MRAAVLLLAGGVLASCTTAQPVQRSASGERELASLLAGKTAGRPISCLRTDPAYDQRIIDGRTVAYRLGGRAVYVAHLSPGCGLLASGNYALLTRQFGGLGTCQGDIVRVFDTSSRMTVGSCTVDRIVPYTR